MNKEIIYCDHCKKSALGESGNNVQFFLTNCGSIICQYCLSVHKLCVECNNSNCAKRPITENMGFEEEIFFRENFTLKKRLLCAQFFQSKRMRNLIQMLNQRVELYENKCEQLMQRNQQLEKEKESLEIALNTYKHQEQQMTSGRRDNFGDISIPENYFHQENNSHFMSNYVNSVKMDTSFNSSIGPSNSIINHAASTAERFPIEIPRRSKKGSLIGTANPLPKDPMTQPPQQSMNAGLTLITQASGHISSGHSRDRLRTFRSNRNQFNQTPVIQRESPSQQLLQVRPHQHQQQQAAHHQQQQLQQPQPVRQQHRMDIDPVGRPPTMAFQSNGVNTGQQPNSSNQFRFMRRYGGTGGGGLGRERSSRFFK